MAFCNSHVSVKGSTLIVACVSLALVPSLSADLLIETLRLRRIGQVSSRYHAPVVGALDGQHPSSSGLTTPVERTSILYNRDLTCSVYQSSDGKLSLLHQRSPPLRVHKAAFVEALRSWIVESGFKDVLLLSSMDAARRSLTSDPSAFRTLGKLSIAPSLGDEPLNSAGITRRLYDALDGQVEVSALLIYVVEASNEEDARELADEVVKAVPAAAALRGEGDWIQPRSWTVGLFGRPAEQAMFG